MLQDVDFNKVGTYLCIARNEIGNERYAIDLIVECQYENNNYLAYHINRFMVVHKGERLQADLKSSTIGV